MQYKGHIFKNLFLFSHKYGGENKMYGYHIDEALYQNFSLPLGQGTGPRIGPIWPYSEFFLILENLRYSHIW